MANRNFARAMRRKTQWAGFGSPGATAVLPTVQDLAVGVASFLSVGTVIGGALGFIEEEVTITRMLASIFVGIRVATAEAACTVAVGCGVFTSEAAAAISSLPSPEDRPDFEWLYYGVFPMTNALGAQSEGSEANYWKLNVDIRAQRIVRAGQTIVWLAESQGVNAFAGVGGRYLAKLT